MVPDRFGEDDTDLSTGESVGLKRENNVKLLVSPRPSMFRIPFPLCPTLVIGLIGWVRFNVLLFTMFYLESFNRTSLSRHPGVHHWYY